MNSQTILKWVTEITFRQAFYLLVGTFLLGIAIVNHDCKIGAVNLLFLYQGIFNTCLFGFCTVPKR